VNALSGLQKSCQFNILQDHVGLISVAHQAVLRLSSFSNMVDMKTTHTSLPFAGHTLHFVEFDPASFREQDLLWLPHYAQLQHAGRKRKTEHLAGRIAAIYALAINVCLQSASYANLCGLRGYTAALVTVGLRH